MSDAKKDIKAKVAARVQEELASAPPVEKKEQKLPLDFLMQCLRHNRIGDATLYAALHRGKYVYVKLWGRWLYWSGHHWMEDIDNLKALAAVDYVCDEYQRILVESSEAEEGSDLVKAINCLLYTSRCV